MYIFLETKVSGLNYISKRSRKPHFFKKRLRTSPRGSLSCTSWPWPWLENSSRWMTCVWVYSGSISVSVENILGASPEAHAAERWRSFQVPETQTCTTPVLLSNASYLLPLSLVLEPTQSSFNCITWSVHWLKWTLISPLGAEQTRLIFPAMGAWIWLDLHDGDKRRRLQWTPRSCFSCAQYVNVDLPTLGPSFSSYCTLSLGDLFQTLGSQWPVSLYYQCSSLFFWWALDLSI